MNEHRNIILSMSLKPVNSAFAPGGVTGRNALFIADLV